MIARHIITAQLTCRDSCAASGAAWGALAALIQDDMATSEARAHMHAAFLKMRWEENITNPLHTWNVDSTL